MYRPPAFREDRPEVLHALIRAHPLGTLITYGSGGLTANLVPFTLVEDGNGSAILRTHLAKANEQLVDLREGPEALVLFQGPQAYVSPSWYPSKKEHEKVVPTWNYVMVQVRGLPQVIDSADWLLEQISHLTETQENHRPDPWKVSDAPECFIASLLNGIVGLEIPIEHIEGKWKVSQNRSSTDRQGVADGLRHEDNALAMADLIETHRRDLL